MGFPLKFRDGDQFRTSAEILVFMCSKTVENGSVRHAESN